AARFPPITKQSLSELDIGSILSNPKLRHDVNFDRELHFRPNLDGAKGRSKIRTAEEYWEALIAELELYNYFAQNTTLPGYDEQAWAPYIKASQVRIPLIFETIRDILKNLLPEREHASVDEHLDVSMLMQEIEKGVCDLLSISRWLAQVLKAHCAPMRDAWVDKMVKQTEIGVQTCSVRSIVYGLRELLGILEAMKLVSYVLILS
ncbi:Protein SOSEKI 1, partial [Coniosporium tulheliwenetii]